MNYLLDTHILLWLIQNHSNLSKTAKDIIISPHNNILFSAVNIWEVSIKYQKGGEFLKPTVFYQALLERNYQELTVNAHHALAVKDLPLIHKDPFDRMLIAQAKTENLILMTVDEKIKQYDDVSILMV